MFNKILIANRGEIACRVIKTARKMGISTVAIYSDADKQALHVQMADEAVHIGPPPANQSYIVIDKVMAAIRATGAQAVHPGYGFLSENSKFAEALEAEGVIFVGPPKGAIEAMGDKITSKKIAQEANVSTVPGYMGLIEDADEAVKISNQIGYPVMIKASAGGGGKGMRIAWNDQEAREGFQSSKNEAANSFGDDRIFIEKFVTQPRHIEIQVLCDSHGNGIYLGERECSIQRRNQKVVEEAPSPFLDEATRRAMGEQAVALAKAVGYASAGTVEFIVDGQKNFYFLEMNTRLQVEHPVTELITGVDLVEQMIRVAAGEPLSITQGDVKLTGWAIENRLYAEDPYRGFLPSIGRLTRYRPPAETAAGPLLVNGKWQGDAPSGEAAVRNDTGVYEGGEISMYYDPMIAKLCTWAPTRAAAIEAMRIALDSFEVEGIGHNLPFLSAVMDHPKFISGDMTTAFIAEEYPEGFEGVNLPETDLRRVAAAAAAMHRVAEIRRTRVSGRMDNHERRVGTEWVVTLQGADFPVTIAADHDGSTVSFDDGSSMRVTSDWTPGDQLANLMVDGAPLVLKVGKISGGFRIRTRGADLKVHVRTPRQAELARLMPEKLPPDTSKMLLCPMPGLIVKVDVEVGQEVQEGQALCTIEAMKMENILRAEKKGVVAKINASAGNSLAVDDVIMEFE
ncbi:acetyl/propionyl/methylcrotonyl-CoA carboxylase subunit alpha [Ruegeria pomeroyi]|jgi:propionyl-CoA carboxylase alpha chain|uniref:Propionyl-CoA carboxylase alpha chain n=3 Tax=Ruegeria pomeroyi TaxID=89184 RepID=PCCA_RUEPO|nr:acetyl/propionyl/methylcrotonyl-CoA carboxylase subunit alpha [Ruegeria pomeroyi]Q5LUF3.1 RecName: Full=Propionyl-CoA carboxylase alpha chain [Ruegeria pomeroyi DSS-3]3N6R_A Chain A, Propionyl-CoA carboxylase, alpha subunit [Ruegeria pomeroyi]3N6R_C Chain C, Propionyl-CoA carboxylase, alpha subunit [Ruegeria pomeroyi]3N6R_E Chain E, Propionyl-CoA carboxylase, alpha subunit [Ruegeria pomeroyi]3N6R_G Chain G, Propionyl-CoA carboxylase, alpha subunit [Ruegeria pomeroyi]3N6R_I Chain I, Propion